MGNACGGYCSSGRAKAREEEDDCDAYYPSENFSWAEHTAAAAAAARTTSNDAATERVTSRDVDVHDGCSGVAGHEGEDLYERRFGDYYELSSVIGKGSTSTVYRCRRKSSDETFATKVIGEEQLRPEYLNLAAQFESEIQALRSCVHPNIIRLEDALLTDGKLYLVMEHLTGGELFDYVVKKGTLSEKEAAGMLRDLTSAIAYMHEKGIVHRDLKPENLLLTSPSNEIKIIDFGLSKILTEPLASSFLGTRGYLAPEMLKREKYTKAVDMWALGVIAYILLCGCLPFDDEIAKLTSPLLSRKFALRYPSWASKLSPNAKSFLQGLLQTNPAKRLTADAALDHVWLRKITNIPNNLLNSPAFIKDKVPKTPKLNRPTVNKNNSRRGAPPLPSPHANLANGRNNKRWGRKNSF